MASLKVPTLQHLARNWRSDPLLVKRELLRLAKNKPTFSYSALNDAVRDMLILQVPYEQIVFGIKQYVRREFVQRYLLDILPLIRDHFEGIEASFVNSVQPRLFPVARHLMVPFHPPLIYGTEGQINFPWFSFWKSNPIVSERLSLFVSVVDEVLLSDPDLECANFEILDFSAPGPGLKRKLRVINARDVPRVSQKTLKEMLSIFARGFFLAQQELAATEQRKRTDVQSHVNRDQLGLFVDSPPSDDQLD